MKKCEILDDEIKNGIGLLIGYPHGGTTIVNSFLNCFENTFSLSEPFWELDNSEDSLVSFDKLAGQKKCRNYEDIKEIIKLGLEEYDVGFIKETISGRRKKKESLEFAFSMDHSIFLILFRKPSYMLDVEGSVDLIQRRVRDVTNAFYSLERDNLVRPISYEDFCRNPVNHMNKVLQDYIVFPDNFSLREEEFTFGSKRAIKSTKIKSARKGYRQLTEEQAELFDESCDWFKHEKYFREKYWS